MPYKKDRNPLFCLEKDGNISFDSKINAGIFKDFYSNLASDLVKQLPTATSKNDMNYVKVHIVTLSSPMGLLDFIMFTKSELLIFL